jgi:dolichol-phosphate mannosyltransferase
MKKFSIIIPAYNESTNLKKILEEIHNSLSNNYNYELIIVNDGSSDNSNNVIEELKLIFPIKLITHEKNLGQSRSILSGIMHSSHNTIVTIDGDGQNNPFDIPSLLNIYFSSDDFSLVGGIRKKRMDNIIKILSSKIANSIRSLILNDNCPDTGCSLKVFNKDIFMRFPYFNGIHRFLPALYKGYGYKTFFIPVDHRFRLMGVSNYGVFDRLFKGIYDLVRVKMIIFKKSKIND